MFRKSVYLILALMIISSLIIIPIPRARAATESYQVVNSADDVFMTGAGNLFTSSPIIPLRDPAIDVTAGFVFRSVAIPNTAHIYNATFNVYVPYDLPYDNGSYVVIGGIDLTIIRLLDNATYFSTLPITYNSVTWDLSSVNSTGWYSVNVTEIVREIINQHIWGIGDDIGLKILGFSSPIRREIAAYDNKPSWAAYLNITYTPAGVSPPAPPGWEDADYWKTYRGFDIWNISIADWLEFDTFTYEYIVDDRVSFRNNTFYNTTNVEEDDDVRLTKASGDYQNSTGWLNRKFGVQYLGHVDGTIATGSGVVHWVMSNSGQYHLPQSAEYITIMARESTDGTNRMRIALECLDGAAYDTTYFIPYFHYTDDHIWFFHLAYEWSSGDWLIKTYNDAAMSSLNQTDSGTIASGSRPDIVDMNYEMALRTVSTTNVDAGFYMRFEEYGRLNVNGTLITYPNGTVIYVCLDPEPCDPPEEVIDEIIGYPDPTDPEPPGWPSTDTFSRYQFKQWYTLAGFLMIIIPILVGGYYKPGISTWVAILFVALFGYALIHSAQFI